MVVLQILRRDFSIPSRFLRLPLSPTLGRNFVFHGSKIPHLRLQRTRGARCAVDNDHGAPFRGKELGTELPESSSPPGA